jgi:REP element-mobilizing transposase RayT
MYHLVCPAKYRRAIFTDEVDKALKKVSEEISKRYEITFLEIGTDIDHVHFVVQSVPMYSPKKIVQIIKSISAKEIFKKCPEVKKQRWGEQLWTDGYFINTVGKHGDEDMIRKYVKNQGNELYKVLHKEQLKDNQLSLW